MKTRVDVIQAFIRGRGYARYLEIGCADDFCFRQIEVPHKVGVDPGSGGTHRMTSDQFFSTAQGLTFDVIFVDGDHKHPQVWKDVVNSISVLDSKGILIMHDCLPPDSEHEQPYLCGTAWRAFARLREDINLDAYTADFDYGVGMIRRRPNSAPIHLGKTMDALSYRDFQTNRQPWMRPVSSEQITAMASSDW